MVTDVLERLETCSIAVPALVRLVAGEGSFECIPESQLFTLLHGKQLRSKLYIKCAH